MTGVARTLDKAEESARRNPLADPGMRIAGSLKHAYGDHRDIKTGEGFYAGQEAKAADEANKKIADDKAQAAAAQAATEAAALAKNQESQVEALKRKGRRASILTSAQGVTDPLGVPGI